MSSIINLHTISQHQRQPEQAGQEIITHQSKVLDFTSAVVVNRKELADACQDVQSVSHVLHAVEALSALDWQDVEDLCRTIHHTAGLLEGMLDVQQKGGGR